MGDLDLQLDEFVRIQGLRRSHNIGMKAEQTVILEVDKVVIVRFIELVDTLASHALHVKRDSHVSLSSSCVENNGFEFG